METPACRQTREQIHEFMEKYKTYKLAKAEILNVINVAPRELVEIDPVVLLLIHLSLSLINSFIPSFFL